MKNKNFLFLFIVILFITLVASCNKLDEKTYSQSSPDNFFSSKSDVDASLVGMYRPLQQCCGGYQQAGNFVLNSASDEGTSAIPLWGQFDDLTYGASANELNDLWIASYRSISAANFVLDNETKISDLDNTPDKSYAKAALAEAKFLRAVNYFQLVQMFGDVPLRISQAKRADEVDIPRNTVDEVYTQIIEDFKDAEANLPATNPAGKPTKWAASAFLAKVYLTRKDFPNALTKAQEVVTSGPYNLTATFQQVFDVNNKNNDEVIFAIQYIRQEGQGMRMEKLVLGPDDLFAAGSSGGWGISNIENGFYNKFNPLDDRITTTFSNPAPAQTTYYSGKWRDINGVSADGHGNDYIVYRYADLLLILAEASNEVNGPDAVAYNSINAVRNRALLPNLTVGLTKDQFRDSVLLERHLELSFEEIRWFDLKRTDRLKSTLIANGKTWNDKYYLFPIPQNEIDASDGKITQNPGY